MRVVRFGRGCTKASLIGAFSALAVFGCSDPIGVESDSTGDPVLAGPQFSGTGTVADLQDAAASGPVRVEINIGQLEPDIIAREVEIESPAELEDREEIRSAVTAAESADGAGSLQLELGGLSIDFDDATRLRIDETKEEPGVGPFVDYLTAELAAGRVPFVRVKRRPAAEAQAPDDATFRADEIRVRKKAGKTQLKLLIDSDNVRMNDAPPPDAFLLVLGLEIHVNVTGGVTEIDDDDHDGDFVKFEDTVAAVDVDALTATLEGGTVIQLDDRTEFDDCDDDDDLCSLAEVRDALDAGFMVKADGKGTIVEGAEGHTILAREIEFEIEDDDDCNDCVEFHGMVVAVDPDASTATLGSGAIIQIDEKTKFDDCDDDDELCSLAEVRDALDAGHPVKAEGKGTVVEDAAEHTILARKVEFEREDDDSEDVEFENTLAEVDAEARTVTLGDGTVVQLDDYTDVKQSDGEHHLGSLEAAAAAHQAGTTVRVKGKGTVVGTDPRTILASEIEFRTEN